LTASARLLTPFLAGAAAAWVTRQRERHRAAAAPLEPGSRSRLAAWFSPATLDLVRVRSVPRLDPPRAVAALRRAGLSPPLEFDRIWGITFVDTVVVVERASHMEMDALLFHECVHAVQYRLLGARGFLDRYVRGWLDAGRRYRAIPLEADAYELAARFAAGDGPFPVEPEVARRLAARGWGTGEAAR
jgi:hypothetical protein